MTAVPSLPCSMHGPPRWVGLLLAVFLVIAMPLAGCGAGALISENQSFQSSKEFTVIGPTDGFAATAEPIAADLGLKVSGLTSSGAFQQISFAGGTSMIEGVVLGSVGRSSVTLMLNGRSLTALVIVAGNFGAGDRDKAESYMRTVEASLREHLDLAES